MNAKLTKEGEGRGASVDEFVFALAGKNVETLVDEFQRQLAFLPGPDRWKHAIKASFRLVARIQECQALALERASPLEVTSGSDDQGE